MKMLRIEKQMKPAIEGYIRQLAVKIPMSFRVKQTLQGQAWENISDDEQAQYQDDQPAYLYNEGMFGTLILSGLLALEGVEDFAASLEKPVRHSRDTQKPDKNAELRQWLLHQEHMENVPNQANDSSSTNSN